MFGSARRRLLFVPSGRHADYEEIDSSSRLHVPSKLVVNSWERASLPLQGDAERDASAVSKGSCQDAEVSHSGPPRLKASYSILGTTYLDA